MSTKYQSALIKRLAANDRPTREAGIDGLRSLLEQDEAIAKVDLLRIWKGLYYCMWMADRPKVQESIATKLAGLVDVVATANLSGFVEAFWITICRDWRSIDVLRIDKYYLLVRRFVCAMFRRLKALDWDGSFVEDFMDILSEYPLNPVNTAVPDGIRYHMVDIYLDELERATDGGEDVPISSVLRPFEALLAKSANKTVKKRVREDVLTDERLELWGYQK